MSEVSQGDGERTIDGRYRIVGTIADGGMATVYKAVDQRLDRTVAVKVIHTQLAEGRYRDQFAQRFHREATSAAAIANPHIVQVYDTGEFQGLQYLVMEYVHGVSLRHVMNEQGCLDVRETLRVLAEILDGLAAAHSAGVVHRDIKPENILINSRGHVQITDFGLARATSQATLSTTGMLLGTAAYLAPEMIERNEASLQGDLYSLGIVVWEMLAGEVPFSSMNAVSLLFKHVHEDIPPISSVCDGIDPAVSDFIAQLTARDPQRRPADASEALNQLHTLSSGLDEAALDYRRQLAADKTTVLPSDETSVLPASGTSVLPSAPTDVLPPSASVTSSASSASNVLPFTETNMLSFADNDAIPKPPAGRQTDRLNEQTVARPNRHRAVWITSAILVVILLLATGGFSWWFYYGPGSYWQLPQPSDLTCTPNTACAIRDISWPSYEAQLQQESIPYEVQRDYSDTVAADHVISTDPRDVQAHVSRRNGAKVTVVVSRGIKQATIADDILNPDSEHGKHPLEALQQAGFTNIAHDETKDAFSTTVPEGAAISVSPEPGTTAAHNTQVTVQLSKGPMPVSMPDVVGRARNDAQAAFDDAKLKISYTEEYSDTVPAGSVISQSVKAGTQMHWGDSAAVVVSKGPEMVTIPDVRGQNYHDAQAALEKLGLKVQISSPLGDITHEVRLQSPDPGAQVRVRDQNGNPTVVTLTVI